tara:strand:- start:98 stop:295 length:198 start_codon:yes stop_codon:yes gene_type:complete
MKKWELIGLILSSTDKQIILTDRFFIVKLERLLGEWVGLIRDDGPDDEKRNELINIFCVSRGGSR